MSKKSIVKKVAQEIEDRVCLEEGSTSCPTASEIEDLLNDELGLKGIPNPKAAIEVAREALESDHTSDCVTHEDSMLPCSCRHGALVKKALQLLKESK